MHRLGGQLRRVGSCRLLWLLAAIVMVWLAMVIVWPTEFWSSKDEYAYLALAHALNLEVRLRDGLYFGNSGLATHPGIPLYVVSWLCLRVVALLTGHRDAVTYALAEPDAFFLATRISAGLIACAAAAGAWRILAPLADWKRALAIGSCFAADPWTLLYGLSFISNETFAFPLCVLLFWAVKKITSSREALLSWVAVGCVAALGYLVKLTYISILVGGVALAGASVLRYVAPTSTKLRLFCYRVAIIFAAFLALSSLTLLMVVGWSQLVGLAKVHGDFVSHTGFLATGPGRPSSLQAMRDALSSLVETTPLPFLVAAAAASLAYYVYAEWRSRTLDDPKLLWCVTVIASFGFATLAVLSHYQYYYVPAIAAFLPFVWKPALERRGLAAIAAIAIVVAGAFTLRSAGNQLAKMNRTAIAIKADEAAIAAMPLNDDEARLWTYRVPSKYFVREFVLQLAGLQSYVHEREKPSKEYSSYANVARPYRYVVFDRTYHADIQKLRDHVASNQLVQPNGMAIVIKDGAIYTQLREAIVVENPK